MGKPTFTGSMRLVGCYILGIILYHTKGHGFPFAGETVAFFLLLFLATGFLALKKPLARRRRWAGLAGMGTILAFALWNSFLRNQPKTLPAPAQHITHYKVTLVRAVALKATSVSTVGRVEAVRAQGKWYPAQGQVAMFFPRSEKADALRYGQQLLVQGSLSAPKEPANPYQFDYKRYLSLKHIQWQAYLPDYTWVPFGYAPPSAVVALSLQVRKKLESAFREQITSAREVAIANALVLGVQDDLDASLRNAFARTGTMHVLAVSGLHVGLLYGVLLLFLKPLRKGNTGRLLVFLIILGVVWFYAFMTGLSVSVLRSVCMFSLVELGSLLRRRSSILNTLALVAFGLLLYEPNFLFDVGFQLSFMAVAGIVLLQPLLLKLWNPENRWVRFIWELLAISVAAQLATFPLSLYYFHQFPVYFWVANLVAVPLTSLGLYIGVAFMMLFWVPVVGGWIGKLLQGTLWLLNELLLWLEQWPAAVLEGFVITPGQVLALYLFLLCGVLFLVQKRLAWLSGAVLCTAFISGTELAEARWQRKSQELVIHSVRRSSAISVVQGRHVSFLADSSFQAQPQQFTYQVQPYWWAKGVREEERFQPTFAKTGQKQMIAFHETADGNKLMVWKGKRLLWLQKKPMPPVSPVRLEAVILQHNLWLPSEKLREFFSLKTVILDQTNSRGYVARKAAELRAAGYQVHVLEENGAWQIRL